MSNEPQTLVVTGAASGIGRGLARAAAAAGMNLVVSDIDATGLATVERELASSGCAVLAIATDVAQPAAVEQLAAAAWDRFGSVEILINNAGIEVGGRSWALSDRDWRRTIDVNLMGPVNGIRAFVPRMIAAGKPAHVAIITSLGALGAIGGQAPYMASKHAAQSLCESLYLELQRDAPFIRVSSVLPAAVATKIWENALGEQNDQARQVLTKVTAGIGLDPDEAGRHILDEILAGRFWITTDDDAMKGAAALRGDFLNTRSDPAWQFDPYA